MTHELAAQALQAYHVIYDGGLALVPTTAGYGLIAMRTAAVGRIYALKGRPATKPCVTVATWPIFDAITTGVDRGDREWAAGIVCNSPLALVTRMNLGSPLIRRLPPAVRSRCTLGDTLATFHAAGPLVCAVAELAFADGELVVGSSANRSGTGNTHTLAEVPREMRETVELTFDQGATPLAHLGRMATTILDLTTGRFDRKGLHFEAIAASWEARFQSTAERSV
jgi:tRNA A37 threonylcarbamoyladenosine synthetase subunit TsaC/SUA5/YrdC